MALIGIYNIEALLLAGSLAAPQSLMMGVERISGAVKPCRMSHPEGMRDKATRGELRAGHLASWGWDRLCAAAHALAHDIVVTLRPRTPAAG